MAYRDDQEPGPRWQHPLGGFPGVRDLHNRLRVVESRVD
jgi:hypothetical protein